MLLINLMETVLDILNKTTPWLAKRGIETARLDAELLLAHVLNCKRLDLYLQFDRPLEQVTLEQLRPLVRRRGEREPLQYIVGSTSFYGYSIQCDKRALIPRSETEQLITLAEAEGGEEPARILELGTGTGAIAIALAHAYPEAHITAIDKSADALALAAKNIEAQGLSGRVSLVESDWYANVDGRFDWIISNPPYLTEAELQSAQSEVQKYEPVSALVAGKDGMADIRRIILEAPEYLNAGGYVFLETGIAQREPLEVAAKEAGFTQFASHQDYSGRDRFFSLQKG